MQRHMELECRLADRRTWGMRPWPWSPLSLLLQTRDTTPPLASVGWLQTGRHIDECVGMASGPKSINSVGPVLWGMRPWPWEALGLGPAATWHVTHAGRRTDRRRSGSVWRGCPAFPGSPRYCTVLLYPLLHSLPSTPPFWIIQTLYCSFPYERGSLINNF